MIPTTVAREARENLLDYLQTTYGLTDPDLERALLEHLAGSEGLFRGPFLDVRLPFRQARQDAVLPVEIAPSFRPYRHQMRAFERLHGQRGHQPQHTLVTTGTGSGKTECFLYPVLDHCWRKREEGKRGIKAILIYPMNALATDQARRLAITLWDDERLKGKVTAGLYVGGKGTHPAADREHLIDDRKILRQAPPDILLTNYKMLDFLLLRPEDQILWRENGPETLRFLVLDELHTYDGAQGSDVACLIRRLKARLETPAGGLCCIGTSATIGDADEESKERLTRFATEIFDERFFSDSVVTEDRLGIEEALGRQIDLAKHPGPENLADLDPRGEQPQAWLARQEELWLGPRAEPRNQVELGEALRKHDFLHQLLRALGGRVWTAGELAERLARREEWFAALEPAGRELVLDSFVALISQAKRLGDEDEAGRRPVLPFLTVQVQLWLREVRNLLRAVDAETRFQWRSELGGHRAQGDDRTRYLPMIRCRDCGCVGLGAVQRPGEGRLRDDSEEREIGRAWMSRSPDVRFIVFGHGGGGTGQQMMPEYLCPRCLRVSHEQGCKCEGPSTPPGLAVRVMRELTQDRRPRFRPLCPECGADDSLIFLGSRASSLLSVAISHLYQTDFNEDRKLLAFVDSVQDASHRAGFFGARTYRFNLRALIQEMLQAEGGRVPLEEVGARLLRHTERRLGGQKKAIPVLLPEDLRAHADYERFLERNGEGKHAELRTWLEERLALEVTFEYGHSVRTGRSLEKTGCSTLEIDAQALGPAARDLALIMNEDGGLVSRALPLQEDETRHFLAGLVNRLRLRGGIHQELLQRYVEGSGNRYMLTKRMNPTGPVFGPDSVLPRFLLEQPPTAGRRSAFDAFAVSADRLTWYRDWAARSLGLEPDDSGVVELYRTALQRLEAADILRQSETRPDRRPVWGLEPRNLTIVDGVREIACTQCKEVVRLPDSQAASWSGRACTKYRCAGHWGDPQLVPETFYTRIFRAGRVARVFPEEHTGLLERTVRERIEEQFKHPTAPDAPNLLVCTPTLEMGIDIGDLSAVLLCSVPPTTSTYLQRIGRAGRATGNALCLTMANGRPHDLYFHADPTQMMSGAIDPPGCFLDAPEMLKRQVVAHAMDAWARQETEVTQIPSQTTAVLVDGAKFPQRFLEYYQKHRTDLLQDFVGRFDQDSLGEASREELARFALSEQVAERVHLAFDDIRRERARMKLLQEKARKRLEELEANPDLALDDVELEKSEIEASRRMLGRLITEQGKRYPLNVLTDAGVLPNYAFPEPGVELDSVIRIDDRGQRRYEAHQYMRSASTAIRELAPFNYFYAEGRRVRVDEIDLGTSAQPLIETWRLCPACNHSERDEGGATPVSACPACGEGRWTDVNQCRRLVYFRRSRSLATRLEAASADEGEERHRAVYQTHDLIDVLHENRSGAHLIEELPFGFELLKNLKLREINFGPDTDASLEVAGHEVNSDGFRVCRDCGRVRPEDPREPIDHTPTCRARRNMTPRIESVYLYREVESEAIRILLPVADLDLEIQQASFRAALELGMRRRFGGRAPHLRIKNMREPIRGGGHRNYLVLFDTVPGGTGYLADLWKADAMLDLLEDTLEALRLCSCLRDDKDGCYRCLYAYQNQRELELTSSAVARKLLDSVLAARDQLKEVNTLSDVVLDSKLESELEERFLRALVGRAKSRGGAQEVMRGGEKRWEVLVEQQRWEVRAQVPLGAGQGVTVACRPDFLISPVSRGADPRPIAVFCDGLAYHVCPGDEVSRLGDDVEKRRALIDSGRYLVWSVTWKDVEQFSAGGVRTAPSLLDLGHSQAGQTVLQRWNVPPEAELSGQNNMELLWCWLRSPNELEWLRKIVAVGTDFVVHRESMEVPTIPVIEDELVTQGEFRGPDPERVTIGPETQVLARLESRFGAKLLGRLSMAACRGAEPRLPVWTLRLYDDHARRQDPQFQESWMAFLQAVNLLQFVPGLFFTSTEDLMRRQATGVDLYLPPREDEGLSMAAERPVEYEAGPDAGAPASPLDELHLLPEEREIAEAAAAAGGGLPEAGFELSDSAGRCLAEAALAWPESKIAVVLGSETSDRRAFERTGWQVFSEDDLDGLIAALTHE